MNMKFQKSDENLPASEKLSVNADHFRQLCQQILLYPPALEPLVAPMHCYLQKKFVLIH